MRSRNSSLWGILCLVLIYGLTENAYAKSVFAIINHAQDIIGAYRIESDSISYQTEHEAPTHGYRVVDITSVPESEFLFVTYEDNTVNTVIELINAKTMTNEGPVVAPGAFNLAGIVFDNEKQKVYTVDRGTNHLFIYLWDADNKTLTLEGDSYIELEYGNAHGIALGNGLLYVTNFSNIVHYYDTDTWTHQDSIDVGRTAVDIDIDPQRNYLYTGGYSSHDFLVKTWLGDPNDSNTAGELDIEAGVIGLAVDPNSGLVYTTTYHNELRVYDTSSEPFERTDYEEIAAGAGVCVSDVSYKPAPPGLHFEKTAEIENGNTCVSPVDPNADEITYEIFYGNEEEDENEPNYLGPLDVVIIDYLPDEIDPNEVTVSDDGVYDSQTNMVTWEIGTLAPGSNGSVTIEVKVIESAEPADVLTNSAEIESEMYYKTVTVDTDICCWGGDIIYVRAPVEPNAPSGVGTSWADAYTDLQDALARAEKDCGTQIWVAAGTYSPGDKTTDTFEIPEDVEVYGGFAGDEDPDVFNLDERDYGHNTTILSGYIDESNINNRIVTAGYDTILNGFWIEDGFHGVYGNNNDFSIANCYITHNTQEGVHGENCNLTVNLCVITNNGYDGIYSSDSGNSLTVNNCKIYGNAKHGINCYRSNLNVKNSMIFYNGEDGTVYYGVKLQNPSDNPVIRNCTIADNINEGIYYTGSNTPDISNSIIWHNNADNGYFQLSENCPVPTYSCVTDPNDPEGEDPSADEPDEETGNISANPYFAYTDPNLADYHLDPCSPCVDVGDPCDSYGGEKDIDGDDRVLNGDDYSPDNGRVDMGADEVACDDIYNPLDWNIDAIVDVDDLIVLAAAWLSDDTPTSNWNPDCDIQPETGDGDVDYGDFAVFADEWHWQPCWTSSGTGMWMMMGMGGGESMIMAEAAIFAPAAAQKEASEMPAETSVEEQIEQIKELLDWLYEVRDTIDEETWLSLVASLEEMLKELEDSQ